MLKSLATTVVTPRKWPGRCARHIRHHLAIALEGARITAEVLVGGELGGIDEDRGHHDLGAPSALAHQAEMALVEKTHRGDESDSLARATYRVGAALHFRWGLDDFHVSASSLVGLASNFGADKNARPPQTG